MPPLPVPANRPALAAAWPVPVSGWKKHRPRTRARAYETRSATGCSGRLFSRERSHDIRSRGLNAFYTRLNGRDDCQSNRNSESQSRELFSINAPTGLSASLPLGPT
jgi:hypothetical protein